MAKYNNFAVKMDYVTTVYANNSSTSTTEDQLSEVVVGGYDKLIYDLEKKVEAFKVKAPICGKSPLRAKIGTKENLKNGQMFVSYKYREDENGKLESVRKGAFRATKIADNRVNATDNSAMTEFYQVAGAKVDSGYTLVQKNDLKLTVDLGFRFVGGKTGA